jgi:hypothetical protein
MAPRYFRHLDLTRSRRFAIPLLTGLVVAAAALSVQVASSATAETVRVEQGSSDSVTLCHATGSTTNPYVKITVDAAGAYDGHYKQHDGDIIPAFTYNDTDYPARGDQAILAAGCTVSETTTTTTAAATTTTAAATTTTAAATTTTAAATTTTAAATTTKASENVTTTPATTTRPTTVLVPPAAGGQAGAIGPNAATRGTVTNNQASSGPIPGSVDAGQAAVSAWKVPLGVALAVLGAAGLLTMSLRRRHLR